MGVKITSYTYERRLRSKFYKELKYLNVKKNPVKIGVHI